MQRLQSITSILLANFNSWESMQRFSHVRRETHKKKNTHHRTYKYPSLRVCFQRFDYFAVLEKYLLQHQFLVCRQRKDLRHVNSLLVCLHFHSVNKYVRLHKIKGASLMICKMTCHFMPMHARTQSSRQWIFESGSITESDNLHVLPVAKAVAHNSKIHHF